MVFSRIRSLLGGSPAALPSGLAAAVEEAAKAVPGPDGRADLVTQGLLSPPVADGGRVTLTLTVAAERVGDYVPVRDAIERAVRKVPGVEKAFVVLAAEAPADETPTRPQRTTEAPTARKARRVGGLDLEGIGAVVAVASGKGGVGKSTTSANLALAFAQLGLKTGVLDADVYGPSMPRLFGVTETPKLESKGKTAPPIAHGVKLMSMGFLIDEGTPMVWRAPMVVSALRQMLGEIEWAPLDVLVIDMPPGTGDTQLTISQQVPLSGAVIVSTPQDLALIDARKGVAMFEKVHVPILGIVENMSTFVCPQCGAVSPIFGHGGARAEAERIGVPFLGEVPLDMAIRETSDAGTPIVGKEPAGAHAQAFRAIAETLLADIEARRAGKRQPPAIVIEDDLV